MSWRSRVSNVFCRVFETQTYIVYVVPYFSETFLAMACLERQILNVHYIAYSNVCYFYFGLLIFARVILWQFALGSVFNIRVEISVIFSDLEIIIRLISYLFFYTFLYSLMGFIIFQSS